MFYCVSSKVYELLFCLPTLYLHWERVPSTEAAMFFAN